MTFSARFDDMLFDYSKTNIDAETLDLLLELAEAADVAGKREAMFAGDKINETEGRAVLHTALRNLDDAAVMVDGDDVMPEVRAHPWPHGSSSRATCASGRFKGQGGPITDVVNIGIGGSDLGPAMAMLALAPYARRAALPFRLQRRRRACRMTCCAGLNPETTLVIVASKTFTTIETMTNAETAKRWMAAQVAQTRRRSSPPSRPRPTRPPPSASTPARVFGFEDWVGGRYSMWGPIGLS